MWFYKYLKHFEMVIEILYTNELDRDLAPKNLSKQFH